MSLENAIRDIAALAPKSSGHLIRHTDWNALINALGEFGKTVRAHDDELEDVRESIDDLGVQLGEVAAKVLALGSRMDDLEASIDPLLQSYVVKMSCERVNFAMGELCVLTAEVTDLRGRPITGPRPWVDFIAAWGRLRAQAGFNSRAGAAGNCQGGVARRTQRRILRVTGVADQRHHGHAGDRGRHHCQCHSQCRDANGYAGQACLQRAQDRVRAQ